LRPDQVLNALVILETFKKEEVMEFRSEELYSKFSKNPEGGEDSEKEFLYFSSSIVFTDWSNISMGCSG
jgi:hypothetical protein